MRRQVTPALKYLKRSSASPGEHRTESGAGTGMGESEVVPEMGLLVGSQEHLAG